MAETLSMTLPMLRAATLMHKAGAYCGKGRRYVFAGGLVGACNRLCRAGYAETDLCVYKQTASTLTARGKSELRTGFRLTRYGKKMLIAHGLWEGGAA